jgi:hypothetical protein
VTTWRAAVAKPSSPEKTGPQQHRIFSGCQLRRWIACAIECKGHCREGSLLFPAICGVSTTYNSFSLIIIGHDFFLLDEIIVGSILSNGFERSSHCFTHSRVSGFRMRSGRRRFRFARLKSEPSKRGYTHTNMRDWSAMESGQAALWASE